MDNASKALIMAASVLLGLLLLSMTIYVFRAAASIDENYDARQGERELQLFNSKFEVFDKNDNTIMDLITVANLAYSINEDYEYDNAKSVEVIIKANDKYFVIPGNNSQIPSGNSDLKFSRNKILSTGNSYKNISSSSIISIYNLTDSDLETIGISRNPTTDKLSTAKIGKARIKDDSGIPIKDNLGNYVFRDNVTVYKYLFRCICICDEHQDNGITYHNTTGRVRKVEFEMYENEEWNI
ncbi:hypothetical protein [uncultured Clostridium sp.]|uniref:hypothetical protein n=1 Tax=uncultured Clostridium sp. TaxID=59620 RepID=UPI0026ED8E11|nr:hypothetical protein [uncultured Clostridium sp.]